MERSTHNVRDDIPSNEVKSHELPNNIPEIIWLLIGCCSADEGMLARGLIRYSQILTAYTSCMIKYLCKPN